MSITTESMTPADIAAVTNNCGGNNGAWGGDWSSWIIIFLIFGMFGYGNRGFGGFGGGAGTVGGDYALATDFATLERKMDGINSGLCDGFYAQNTNMLNGFAGINNAMCQGFSGVNTAIMSNGYETRNAINGVSAQIANCCCDTREAISNINYNLATQSNAVQRQIADCCCETGRQIERGFCDTNYNLATQNSNTLQAIDKVGDRIIDYLANEKAQALRDENQALRLAASQQAQNNYLVNQLRPCPTPSYIVANPYCCNTPCGCNG